MKSAIKTFIFLLSFSFFISCSKDDDSKLPEITFGFDISVYFGNDATALIQNDSIKFVICKATEGISYVDPNFNANWRTIQNQNKIRGAYHYYSTTEDPIQQADHFFNALGVLDADDLPPIIVFENPNNNNVVSVQTDLIFFLEKLAQDTNRIPIIYTNNSVANNYLSDAQFAKYSLWIKDYTNNSEPDITGIWLNNGRWTFWNKSSKYESNNINDTFDVFNGSFQELQNFISVN